MEIKHGLTVDCNLHLIWFSILLSQSVKYSAHFPIQKTSWSDGLADAFLRFPLAALSFLFFNFDWFSGLSVTFVSIGESEYSVVTVVSNHIGFCLITRGLP